MVYRRLQSLLEPLVAAVRSYAANASDAIRLKSIFGERIIAEPRVPAAIYFATLVTNLLALALPLTILQVYDRIIPNHARETLFVLFAGLSVALIFDFVLKNARSALLSWQSTQFVRQISDEAVARIMAAPTGMVEREPLAVHFNRYGALGALGDYHAGQSRIVAIDLPFVTISLIVMTLVGGMMVLVPILLFFFFAALSIRRSRDLRDVIEQRSVQDHKKYDFVTEVLGGILSVKAMAMEPQMQRRYERLQHAVAEITARSILASQAAQTSAVLYGNVSQVVVVMIGAMRVIDDQLSMGALACCTMLSGQILQPLLRTISLWMENETIGHRRNEINALLSWPMDARGGSQQTMIEGSIVCENVGFSYTAATAPIFSNVNLDIPMGSVVGVQGEDGSGRSTLLKVLRGELHPTVGTVRIAGVLTTDPSFADIRSAFAYVGSVPVIFRGTVLENLTLFRPEKNSLARRMCPIVGLDRVINVLPEGFETRLGEGIADDLSISVIQQISIVRALTCEPSILILDEANTVLDRVAEASLIRAIHALRGQKTTIVATHRPSLLATSDLIIRIGDEKVVCEQNVRAADPYRGVA
jgi:ATP-binding cassette subfamily C protein LapB